MSTLFGESPGSSTDQYDLFSKEQRRLFKELIAGLRSGEYGGGQGSATSLTALENWANQLFSGDKEILEGRRTDFSDFFEQTIEKPLFETYEEDIKPGISNRYAPSGFWSSQRVEAEGQAHEDLIDALTQGRSRVGYEAYQSDLNRLLQQQGLGAQSLLGIAGTRQAGQMGRQGLKQNEASLMLQALGISPFENIVKQTGGSSGLAPSLIGAGGYALGSLWGGGGSLFGP